MSIPPAGGTMILIGAVALAGCGSDDDVANCVVQVGPTTYAIANDNRCDDDGGGGFVFVHSGGHTYRAGDHIDTRGKKITLYKPSTAKSRGIVSPKFGKSSGFGSTAKGGSSGGGSRGSGS